MEIVVCKQCIAEPFCRKTNVDFNTKVCGAREYLTILLRLSNMDRRQFYSNIYSYDKTRPSYDLIKPVVGSIVEKVDGDRSNFIIVGAPSGAGKTFAACTLANHYIYAHCVDSKFQMDVPVAYYVDFAYMVDYLRYERDDDSFDTFKSFVMNTPLLILDDIGSGKMSEYAREQTNIIVNYRFNKMYSNIITSNLTVKQLASDGVLGQRAMTRLMDNKVEIDISKDSKEVEGLV